MAVRTTKPWEITTMRSESPAEDPGRVKAEIWMEKDGLHGIILNGTSMTLKEGKVITSYGFVSVPTLKPGDRAEFSLLEEPDSANSTTSRDGKMSRNAGYSLYSMTYSALGLPEYSWDGTNWMNIWQNMISASLDQISGGDYYSSNSQSVFLFTAEAEDLLPLVFRADGKTVKNVAGSAVLNVEMEYLSTGRTGVIYRMPGMDKAVKMLLDENGMPADEAERDPKDSYYSNYHPLSENPAFRFDLESIRDAEITSLSIVLPAYVARVRCFLLNAETGEWDRIEVNGNIDHPEKYLNREWQLFCRFESETYEYDTDIPTPTLSLEGREQHAEN